MARKSPTLLFLAFVVICVPCLGQTVDTAIVGTVRDSAGASISGATLTVTSLATGIQKKAVTTASGEYSITYLIPGTYNVTIVASGFTSNQRTGVTVQLNSQTRIDAIMQVGRTSQTVEVTAAQPLLQNESSSLGVVVGTVSAEKLPLNGRKFNDLAILTPGVTVTNPDNHSSTTDGGSINAYGSQVVWSQVNIDGVTMVNNRHAYVNAYPSVDAIQEFNVFTSNYEAEYGGNAGTITNIQLKSGTNAFHGDAFEFLRNTAMDARNYFINSPAPQQVLKQNQFGVTLGGPIIKDRTFFFFSYEGLRSVEQSAGLTSVLTPAEKNGDFSSLLPGIQLVSPYTGLPYPGNKIPVDPVAQNIAETYMPLPNTNQHGSNYAYVTGGDESVNQYIAHIDHRINGTNQLGVHFLYAFRNFPSTDPNPNFSYTGTYPIYNAGLQYLHTFSPNLINELRLGIDLEHVKQLSTLANTGFTAASIGINGFTLNGAPIPSPDEGFPVLSSSDLISMGSGTAASNLDDSRTYQAVDNVTWIRGRHTLIFGTDIRFHFDNATTDNTPYGQINFSGSETGYDGADFILGVPSEVITPEGVPLTKARQWRDFFYLQDNWKATPHLTLNMGLRYALWLPPHNELDTSRTLDWSTSPPSIVPLPDPLWHITHKDFAPRLGFAYSLPEQAVLRGGYAITWFGGQFDHINILQLNPPADPSFSLSNGTVPSNPPTSTLQNPVSPSITPANANVVSLPQDGDHPDMYLQTWNLTLSKQFQSNVLDISYVGVKGTHEPTSDTNFNVGPPQPASGSVQANRPFPIYGRIRLLNLGGLSNYNGLNVHFEHRLTNGLNLTAAYSWGHLLQNYGADVNAGGKQTQRPNEWEWASGSNDIRNNLTVAFVWQLPGYKGGNSLQRAVLSDWGVNGIFQYISGSPLWITQGRDGEHNGSLWQRPDLVPGQSLTLHDRSVGEWFNTAAFTEADGHYGSTPRNPLSGPSNNPLTLAVIKTFPIPFKGQSLNFRVEAFNVLNHPQFSPPGTDQSSSTFGQLTSTSIDNRDLQVALKYIF